MNILALQLFCKLCFKFLDLCISKTLSTDMVVIENEVFTRVQQLKTRKLAKYLLSNSRPTNVFFGLVLIMKSA